MRSPRLPLLILMLLAMPSLRAGPPVAVRIASYNAETMYDTTAGALTRDAEWTPRGGQRWGTQRYERKVANIARVLDDLGADIVAVSEIESEEVVRDLVTAMRSDYNYLYHEGGDRSGMNTALLYRGALFFPETARPLRQKLPGRQPLAVTGMLYGERITIIVCHLPSQLNTAMRRSTALEGLRAATDSLLWGTPQRKLIVMGDFNTPPDSRGVREILGVRDTPVASESDKDPGEVETALLNPFARLVRQGYGSYAYRDRWYLYDYILLSPALLRSDGLRYTGRCGIFVREYMTEPQGLRKGYPARTFTSRRYTGGCSDHLPVFIELEVPDAQ